MAASCWCCLFLLARQAVSLRRLPDAKHQAHDSPSWRPQGAWLDDLSYADSPGPALTHRTKSAHREEGGYLEKEGHLEEYLLAYPPAKLVFCYIPKNACAEFNSLLNEMNGKFDWFMRSSLHAHGLKLGDVSRDKGWKWAVFLRDPLMRYLSAWGSKCVMREDRNHCEPAHNFSHYPPGSDGSVKDFHNNVLVNWRAHPVPQPPRDDHWRHQQDFCGGLHGTKGYDFVGHLRGDVHGQVKSMLEMVGAPVHLVQKHFPQVGVAGHFTKLDPEVYYNDSSVRKMVQEMYSSDYDMLPELEDRAPITHH